MKQLLILTLVAGATLFYSCSKSKSTPIPANVITYKFTATQGGVFEVNFTDFVSGGAAQNVNSNTWSESLDIPSGTKTSNIFFTAAENPPYTGTNVGTVTISLNGKVVATGSMTFTGTSTLAQANYTYSDN